MRDVVWGWFVEDVRRHCMADEAAERNERDRYMSRELIVGHRRVDRNEIRDVVAVNSVQAEDRDVLYDN